MRFWDSSALVPLLVEETTTRAVIRTLEADQEVVIWWATGIECASALTRREREGALSHEAVTEATGRLDLLIAGCDEIAPVDAVRQSARRILRVHPLRAADALQLAAAWVASEHQPETMPVVTLDAQLAAAAEREGFPVVRPAT